MRTSMSLPCLCVLFCSCVPVRWDRPNAPPCLLRSELFTPDKGASLAGTYDLRMTSEWEDQKGRIALGRMELWAPDTLLQWYLPDFYDQAESRRHHLVLRETPQRWTKSGGWKPLIGAAEIDLASMMVPGNRISSRDPFEPGLRLEGIELEISPVKLGYIQLDGSSASLIIERVAGDGFSGRWTTSFFGTLLRHGREVENPSGRFCARRVSQAPDTAAGPITWSDSVDATERTSIRATGGKVWRTGSELHIRLVGGRIIMFRDDTTAGLRYALPRYAGYLKSLRAHVIHRVPYEGTGTYLIVNDSAGDTTMVFGMPVPSPDGTRFALTSMSDFGGFDPNLIEVWRMIDGRPKNEFSFESEDWQPSDPVWRNSVTIDFIKNSGSDPSKPYVRTAGRLIRAGTKWSFATR